MTCYHSPPLPRPCPDPPATPRTAPSHSMPTCYLSASTRYLSHVICYRTAATRYLSLLPPLRLHHSSCDPCQGPARVDETCRGCDRGRWTHLGSHAQCEACDEICCDAPPPRPKPRRRDVSHLSNEPHLSVFYVKQRWGRNDASHRFAIDSPSHRHRLAIAWHGAHTFSRDLEDVIPLISPRLDIARHPEGFHTCFALRQVRADRGGGVDAWGLRPRRAKAFTSPRIS